MLTSFTRLDPVGRDHDELVEFMTGNEFPFHGNRRPTRESTEAAIGEGAYRDVDNDSFWIDHIDLGRIGFFRLEDLSEDTPVFDLRLQSSFRNRGLGVEVLHAAARYVFTALPNVSRFEGQTREDNIAMRRTFLHCGWVKEAHYREAWPVEGGPPVASVAYAILRRDWETGRTTTLLWEDLAI